MTFSARLTIYHTFNPLLKHLHLLFAHEAYETRIELAVLDHNAHVKRNFAKNRQGEVIYHRKYCKQSKKWDITPTLEQKKFDYIPDIIQEVEREREQNNGKIKKNVLRSDHPALIQPTIGHTVPLPTSELAVKKKIPL